MLSGKTLVKKNANVKPLNKPNIVLAPSRSAVNIVFNCDDLIIYFCKYGSIYDLFRIWSCLDKGIHELLKHKEISKFIFDTFYDTFDFNVTLTFHLSPFDYDNWGIFLYNLLGNWQILHHKVAIDDSYDSDDSVDIRHVADNEYYYDLKFIIETGCPNFLYHWYRQVFYPLYIFYISCEIAHLIDLFVCLNFYLIYSYKN